MQDALLKINHRAKQALIIGLGTVGSSAFCEALRHNLLTTVILRAKSKLAYLIKAVK